MNNSLQIFASSNARPVAEAIVAALSGSRFMDATACLAETVTGVATEGRSIKTSLAAKIYRIVEKVPLGVACEALRIADQELDRRVWRTEVGA